MIGRARRRLPRKKPSRPAREVNLKYSSMHTARGASFVSTVDRALPYLRDNYERDYESYLMGIRVCRRLDLNEDHRAVEPHDSAS